MELISHYFHLGYEYEVILEFLSQCHDISLSMRSLKRRLRGYSLRRNANDVDEQRLRNIIRSELKFSGGSLVYRAVWQSLRLEHKVHVPRRLVAEIIRELDPEGVQNRRRRRLTRRRYKNWKSNWKLLIFRLQRQKAKELHATYRACYYQWVILSIILRILITQKDVSFFQ